MKGYRFLFYVLLTLSVLPGCTNIDLTHIEDEEIISIADNLEEMIDEISSEGETVTAMVDRVVDGDTIEILCDSVEQAKALSCYEDTMTVRILNIDTPETHGDKAPQEYGEEASEFAKSTLSGKTVSLELSQKSNPFDNYGRLLAYVFIDGKMYEELIVREGLARVGYLYEPDTKYAEQLKTVQAEAAEEGKNIWSIPGYVTEKGFNMSVVK